MGKAKFVEVLFGHDQAMDKMILPSFMFEYDYAVLPDRVSALYDGRYATIKPLDKEDDKEIAAMSDIMFEVLGKYGTADELVGSIIPYSEIDHMWKPYITSENFNATINFEGKEEVVRLSLVSVVEQEEVIEDVVTP